MSRYIVTLPPYKSHIKCLATLKIMYIFYYNSIAKLPVTKDVFHGTCMVVCDVNQLPCTSVDTNNSYLQSHQRDLLWNEPPSHHYFSLAHIKIYMPYRVQMGEHFGFFYRGGGGGEVLQYIGWCWVIAIFFEECIYMLYKRELK